MIPIKTAIKRIRGAIHDWQHINYSDAEILLVINAGLRFIRRTIADIQLEILVSEFKGILQHLRNKNLQGEHAKYFYRVGLKTLKLFPVPKFETAYTVRKIDDFEELTLEDETPLLNDFDDFLIEYATMRLSIDNEYDATQEQQILSAIQSQIAQILSPPPTGTVVRGYW